MNLKRVSVVAAMYFILSFLLLTLYPKQGFYINVFDVGQGDSIFIRTAEGITMLIDGGDNSQADQKLNKEMLFPFCHLNYLLVTHPHSDHIKGFEKILKRCSVDIVMFNDVSYESAELEAFRQLLEKNKVINAYRGDEFNFGNVFIKILWPPRELFSSGIKNLNDISTVVFLDFGNFEALFMGDLQDNNQAKLATAEIKKYIEGYLDVLKVAHHGSKNGVYLPLIEELKPEKCIISVGSDNKFGHPDSGAITNLEAAGCLVLRTDLIGDIVIEIN